MKHTRIINFVRLLAGFRVLLELSVISYAFYAVGAQPQSHFGQVFQKMFIERYTDASSPYDYIQAAALSVPALAAIFLTLVELWFIRLRKLAGVIICMGIDVTGLLVLGAIPVIPAIMLTSIVILTLTKQGRNYFNPKSVVSDAAIATESLTEQDVARAQERKMKRQIICGIVIAVIIAWGYQFGGGLFQDGPLKDWLQKKRDGMPVVTTWQYTEKNDVTSGSPVKIATLNSTNAADTGFGPTGRMRLVLIEREGKRNVTVHIIQGMLACASSKRGTVEVQFDDGSSETVNALYSNQNLVLDRADMLFNRIKAAKKMTVDAIYLTNTGKVHHKFNFNIAGLSWQD